MLNYMVLPQRGDFLVLMVLNILAFLDRVFQ